MHRISIRTLLAALGLGIVLAAAPQMQPVVAQTAPRALPANPEGDNRPRGIEPDREFDRNYDPNYDRDRDRQVRPRAEREDRSGSRIERRLDYLHSVLRITPAQERAWTTFADAVRDEDRRAFDRLDQFQRQARDRRTAPRSIVERLEERQEALENQSARLDHLLSTLRPLYASLSANQKRIADEELFQPGLQGFQRLRDRLFGRFFDSGRAPTETR